MSTKIASLFVEIGAKVDGLTRGLKQAQAETRTTAGSIKDFVGSLTVVTGVALAVGAAIKKAFDMAEAGAQIVQVESAFNSLIGTLGAAPSTLNQMQVATRNTVSELSLMSSATTFLKGATGEMGTAFAGALPELAAVAQAAHDLNPTMGTTADMFERLTRGVRKAEPELLDEMGLIFRLDNVYRNYAATLGKTADQLTVEEKSMATLNEVLRQGNTLVEQAAAVNTGASDTYAKMGSAISDAGDAIKENAAPAMTFWAQGITATANQVTRLFTGSEQVTAALQAQAAEVTHTATTYSDYTRGLQSAATAAGLYVDSSGNLVNQLGSVVQENYLLSQSAWSTARAFQTVADQGNALSGGLSTLDAKAQGFTASITGLDGGLSRLGEGPIPTINSGLAEQAEQVGASEEAWGTYGERMTAAAEAAGRTAITMDELQIMSVALAAGLQGTLGDATAAYTAGLGELQAQQAAIIAQMAELEAAGATNSAQYMQLTEALGQNQQAQEGALAGLQQLTAETIYQQAAVGLDTQAALELARGMGVLSEADYATATAVQTLRQEFDKNKDGMIDASEGAARFAASTELVNRAVQNLQAKGLPITLDNISKEMAELAASDASGEMDATAGAADEGAGSLEDFGGAADTAGQGAETLAGAAENAVDAIKSISGLAGGAAGGINTLRGAAQNSAGPINAAATAAGRLADAMRGMPRSVSISAAATGFSAAISWVEKLTTALNNVPTSISATIKLSSSGSGGGGGDPGPAPRSAPASSAPSVTKTSVNNYFVDNPLAAAMLVQQQGYEAANRLESLMA